MRYPKYLSHFSTTQTHVYKGLNSVEKIEVIEIEGSHWAVVTADPTYGALPKVLYNMVQVVAFVPDSECL